VIIDVDLYAKIRHMYVQQKMSQRAIAKALGISRNTVKKYCKGEHVPWERQPYHREAPVVTKEVRDFIRQCLDEDAAENIPKQYHTARCFLQDEIPHLGMRTKTWTPKIGNKDGRVSACIQKKTVKKRLCCTSSTISLQRP